MLKSIVEIIVNIGNTVQGANDIKEAFDDESQNHYEKFLHFFFTVLVIIVGIVLYVIIT